MKVGRDPLETEEDDKLLETAKALQAAQRQRNKDEFGEEGAATRLLLEGYRQGIYTRMVIKNIPAEFIHNFSPRLPIILGGLLAHEGTNMCVMRARVKRHRWHRKILKSNDPLIFSVGWRRYQVKYIYLYIYIVY